MVLFCIFIVLSVSSQEKRQFFSIGTGTISGTYYSLGNSLANLLNEKDKDSINFSAASTSGSVQNALYLGQKEIELAFINNDVAKAAFKGLGDFSNKKVTSLRGIVSIYGNSIHVIVNKKSNINKIEDLRGKRVSVGTLGSGVESITRMIMEIYDINYLTRKDFRAEFVGVSESMDQLKNGQLDAVFMTGLPPMGAIVDVFMGKNVKLISIENDKIEKLIVKYPELYSEVIPARTYNGQEEDIKTVANAALLLTRDELSEDYVYNITKNIFENLTSLITKNNVWGQVKSESAFNGMTVPIHPGAEKYFKEIGIIK
jgi:TRAP transporter TAXI family solute receptor